MKWLSIVLGGALVVLLLLFLQTKSRTDRQLATTREQLTEKTQQLESAQAEVAQVKATMEKNFQELEGKVSTLMTEKVAAQEKIDALADDMQAILADLQTEKSSRRTLEARNVELGSSLESVSGDLNLLKRQQAQLEQQHHDLEQTHAQTMEHLAAMREDYVNLTREKEELEAKWTDLAALKSQIGTVKLELRKQHIEEWKRSDRIEGATGNQGFIMKGGEWTSGTGEAASGGKFPLTEDIRRDQ